MKKDMKFRFSESEDGRTLAGKAIIATIREEAGYRLA